MNNIIDFYTRRPTKESFIFLVRSVDELPNFRFSLEEKKHLKSFFNKEKQKIYTLNRIPGIDIVVLIPEKKINFTITEDIRRLGSEALDILSNYKISSVYTDFGKINQIYVYFFMEGFLLNNYNFLKYKTDKDKNAAFSKIFIKRNKETESWTKELSILTEAVFHARDLVNEPLSGLNAQAFADWIEKSFKKLPVKTEILNKTRIKALKMGGLLGVNRGSKDAPVFCIIEYKSAKAVNKKPYVFVGKGVMYDTGGMNLKPGSSMADMKCDMSGGAAVAGAMYAIAKNKLPVHAIGLIPATDNRTGEDAYVPGDILKMYDGTTVEVLNTDAEGRLVLADALAYAKKYDPELLIDIATLTGSAHSAIGNYAIVGMTESAKKEFKNLQKAGNDTFERIVEFPFWDEYSDQLKSDIADLANIGGRYAGAITAGKFLEHFAKAPYIHLDIAGPAFLNKKRNYWPKGGTGVGVRLFYNFMKSRSMQEPQRKKK